MKKINKCDIFLTRKKIDVIVKTSKKYEKKFDSILFKYFFPKINKIIIKGVFMDYSKLKIAELRVIAKEKGLRNITGTKKKELVELLTNVDKMLNRDVQSSPSPVTNASENAKQVEGPRKRGRKPKNQTVEVQSVPSQEQTEALVQPVKRKRGRPRKNPLPETIGNAEVMIEQPVKEETMVQEKPERVEREEKPERFEKSDRSEGRFDQSRNNRSNGHDIQLRKQQPPMKQGSKLPQRQQPGKTQVSVRQNNQPLVKTKVQTPAVQDNNTQMVESGEEVKLKVFDGQEYNPQLMSDERAYGILEVMPDGYGFLRCDNYMPGDKDIYMAPGLIRKFGLKTGDMVRGPIKAKSGNNEKFGALLYIESVNGMFPSQIGNRKNFEELTPIFPNERIKLDYDNAPASLRMVDFFSPIGKGQRGMIVSPPKAGKTTLLKQIAKRISVAYPDTNLLVLLIDERPEEVTDIKESIEGPNVEVIYSTFDELPEHHKRVSEMVIERAKRLVESSKDVVILIDSITRLSRAYNLTVPPSGRTLSGGLDPAALHMPKRFFGAARNMREGGSLTILATALIETGSRMDDVVFEEFKGTGNMELVLDRELSNKRVFPAIDIVKSGTRKDDLLLDYDEQEALNLIHQQLGGPKSDDITEEIIKLFGKTKNNKEFIYYVTKLLGKR